LNSPNLRDFLRRFGEMTGSAEYALQIIGDFASFDWRYFFILS
jgi:hypothetical protein